jgi:CheY-like chemotaxis protein
MVFSRRQALQLRAVSVNEAVRGMTAMISRLIGREIQVRSACADGLPMIQADAAMVDQLLLNLLVNGRDAMPQGGELWISTSVISFNGRSVARHPEARAGQFIKLSIRDSGTGIAPEHLPHIFEPFFTTKETGKGTGLGLAIVYGIVKQHQGWIEVASEPGKGTTFDIYLPATAGVPAGAPVMAPKVAGGSEMILMVEDEESVRVLARRMLENAGYSVHAAASGAAAFDLWKKHGREVDLLLADFMLPDGVNGYDLAEKFRTLKPNLKVILTSGYSPEELGTGSARDGAVFLPKPFSMRVLLQTVRRSLDNQLDAAQP